MAWGIMVENSAAWPVSTRMARSPRISATRAGFVLEAKRPFVVDLPAPLPPATARYAQVCLRKLRSHLDGRLPADDLAALEAVLDGDGPHSVLRRDDLTVRTTRTTWAARRP